MRSYGEYEKTALRLRPFDHSVVTGGWEFSVCDGGEVEDRGCVHRSACPLLRLGRESRTPVEWTDGGRLVWRCTEKTTATEVSG